MGCGNHSARLNLRLLTAVCLLTLSGCGDDAARRAAVDQAGTQVRRIAHDLDGRTTETGVYVRVKADEVTEKDPWGTRVQVTYSQGGVAEVVTVRSAGPDRRFHTPDDLVAQGMSANLKGIGEGIKKNTEETAAKAAKGLVKGAVSGIKESVKDALPFKKKDRQSQPKSEPAPRDDQREGQQASEKSRP